MQAEAAPKAKVAPKATKSTPRTIAGLLGKYGSYFDYAFYGMWLSGSTLNEYEFPIHYVYYNGEGDPAGNPEKLKAYGELYDIEDFAAYIARLGEIGGATMVASGFWLDAHEMEQLVEYLPGADLSLPAEEQYGFAMVMEGDGTGLYHAFGAEGVGLSLAEYGISGEVSSGLEEYDHITVDGRDYSLHYEGLNIAVYDEDFGCVMDWFSLFCSDGEVYFKREPPPYVLYGYTG